MKEKGFTLIEIMGVLVILGVTLLVVTPVITESLDNGKETSYNAQLKQIKKAAGDWAADHASGDYLPTTENDEITITLGALKQGGYIDKNITNPITKEEFPNCMFISIKRHNNNYVYEVLDAEEELPENCSTSNDSFAATVILKGGTNLEVALGSGDFIDPGITATSNSGQSLDDEIKTTIYKEGSVVTKVDTTKVGEYKIEYVVVSNGTEIKTIRRVSVKDKTAPVITVNGNTSRFTLTVSKNSSFTVPSASAVDEIDGDITSKITVTSNVNISVAGTYEIEYSVSDSANNKRSLKVIVVVT